MESILIKNAKILTMTNQGIIDSDILVVDDRIARIDADIKDGGKIVINAANKVVVPGFVQTHVHLCQTLFRGYADDMELLDWLRLRTWPIESAHDYKSTYYSGMLSCMELIRSGTTCVANMGSIQNTDADAQAMFDMGIRGKFGKAMTDFGELPPELGKLPGAFSETTEESIESSMALLEKWHHKDNNRIQYLFAPRGILSSSEQMLLEVKKLADQYGTGVHVHACENRTEMKRVIEQRGSNEIQYLDRLGLSGPNLMLAHCVWANEADIQVLARTGTNVLHCPSANLKLASGIAPIPAMVGQGVNVSVGADGAPCNNNLDAFVEMRMAALIQKGHLLDPTVMPAKQVLEMATINGAKALGLEAEIGSVEVGKKADLVILDLFKPHSIPFSDLYAAIVYSCSRENVDTVIIDGKILLDEGYFLKIDPEEMLRKCQAESQRLLAKAGIL